MYLRNDLKDSSTLSNSSQDSKVIIFAKDEFKSQIPEHNHDSDRRFKVY